MNANKNDGEVVVYSDNGIMQGKVYTKESRLADEIRSLMWKCTDTVRIVVKLNGR